MELFKLWGRIMIDNDKAVDTLTETEKKAKEASEEIANMGKEAAIMAGKMAAAGAAVLGAIGVKSATAADGFRKAMNLLQAQTGKSKEEMSAFETSAKQLYKSGVGNDFEDIARAMSDITRNTGLSGDELEKTSKSALKLRDVFEFEVNESSRTAGALMKQFGITSEEAYEIITQSAQQGANKNGDLLDTLNEYSGMFKVAGYSADEFGNILIQGAKDGAFSIDAVGDAVKESNIRLKDGSKTSREAVEGLGLSYDQIAGNFAEGGKLAAQAYNAVLTNLNKIEDPLKKNDMAVKLFGTKFEDLETTILGTLTNAGKHIDLTKKSIDNMAGSETFGSAFKKIGRQLTVDFFIPLGEKLVPKLIEFSDWIKNNQTTIEDTLGGAVSVVGGIFDGLASSVKWLGDNMNWLLPIIVGVTSAILAQQIIGWVTTLYGLWTTATATQTTAQWLLNAAVKASPFGLVALAIGVVIGLGLLLITHWDTVKAIALSVWGTIKTFFASLGPFFSGIWNGIKVATFAVWNGIKLFFTTTVDGIKTVFSGLKSTMKAIFDGIWIVVKTPINLIIGGINALIGALEKAVNFAGEAINKIPDISIPSWVPVFGGSSFGIPDIPTVDFPEIPKLAAGGTIDYPGRVMVGERGPEFLDLPKGARVTPLDKEQQPIVINIERPTIMNERDAEKLGDLLVKYLKLRGIQPRGL